MFIMGAKSVILAIGITPDIRVPGKTARTLGATPKLHCSCDDSGTAKAMMVFLPSFRYDLVFPSATPRTGLLGSGIYYSSDGPVSRTSSGRGAGLPSRK
jgi:hypothetical protein